MLNRFTIFTLIFSCSLVLQSNATNYYVSNAGNDGVNGTSPETAWASISKVNSSTFLPGDAILFQRGDTWRERLIIPSSGSSGNPITIGVYGSGSMPKIYGSTLLTQWTQYSGNIWRSTTTVSDPTFGAPHDGQSQGTGGNWPGGIFFRELDSSINWGHRQKYWPTSNLTQPYDWVWNGGFIYIYASSNPSLLYAGVEVAQRQSGINMNDREHIVIRDLEIRFTCSAGINENFPQSNIDDVTIDNCYIAHVGIKNGASGMGITLHHSNSRILNCTINNCGRRGINLLIVAAGLTVENNLVENNTVSDCYHTGIDMILTANSTIRNITFKNNYLFTSTSENLVAPESYSMTHFFLAKQTTSGTYTGISLMGNRSINPSEKGIQTQSVDDLEIYNNTFYGINPYQNTAGAHIWIEGGTATIYNNILFGTVDYSFNSNWQTLFITNPQVPTTIDYNLYYQQDNTAHFAQVAGVFYFPGQWNNYQSATGYDAHSISPQNPMITSLSSLELQAGSPCIDIGTNVGLPFIGSGPDLGAVEFDPYCSIGFEQLEYLYSNNGTPGNLADDYYLVSINLSNIEGATNCSYEVLFDGLLSYSNLSCGQVEQFNLPTNGNSVTINLVENPISTCDLIRSFEITLPASP